MGLSSLVETIRSAQLRQAQTVAILTEGTIPSKSFYTRFRDLSSYLTNIPQSFKPLIEQSMQSFSLNAFILDLGCGNAGFLRDLSCQYGLSNLYGIDLEPPADPVDYNKIKILLGDLSRSRVFRQLRNQAPHGFDLIISTNTFPYLANPLLTLKMAYSLLASDGLLCIRQLPIEFVLPEPNDRSQLKLLLINHGFSIISSEYRIRGAGWKEFWEVLTKKTPHHPGRLSLPIRLTLKTKSVQIIHNYPPFTYHIYQLIQDTVNSHS